MAFALGFSSKLILDTMAETNTETTPELRIFDSCIQWSDGARWHIFAGVDELAANDPVAAAQKQALANQMPAEQDTTETAPENAADDALGLNRGTGSVATYYSGGSGGGSSSGGGGSDGQDISWSGDYL